MATWESKDHPDSRITGVLEVRGRRDPYRRAFDKSIEELEKKAPVKPSNLGGFLRWVPGSSYFLKRIPGVIGVSVDLRIGQELQTMNGEVTFEVEPDRHGELITAELISIEDHPASP